MMPDRAETSCPTIPFASLSPSPGRRALPPGGDNVTYSRAAHSSISEPARTDAPRADTPHNNALVTSANSHVGKWRVQRVVQHRGKDTHRTKLHFRVQWEPLDGKVSPDTWIPWNQARWLDATRRYAETIPLLRYLLPHMPSTPPDLIPPPRDDERLQFPKRRTAPPGSTGKPFATQSL